ncbi:hypothetical protein E4U59_005616 [Claviceps monticola]|nr:hypothetical protein E4U59_005616 [Claviceps monticola]
MWIRTQTHKRSTFYLKKDQHEDITIEKLREMFNQDSEEAQALLNRSRHVGNMLGTRPYWLGKRNELAAMVSEFLKDVIAKKFDIVDSWWRVEFQARGSPHVHMLLWLRDCPTLDVKDGDAVAAAAAAAAAAVERTLLDFFMVAERDISAQEVMHILLGLPLSHSSRSIYSVDCRTPDQHWKGDMITRGDEIHECVVEISEMVNGII